MLELLIMPKRAERKPWQMFFVGLIYASLSMFLAKFLFLRDNVQIQYLGWIVVFFSVLFSMPFVYYTIKLEEKKDRMFDHERRLLTEHAKAIMTFLWLFLGFIVAFSIGYTNPNALGFVIVFIMPLIFTFHKLLRSFENPIEQKRGKYFYLMLALVWLVIGVIVGLHFFNSYAIFGVATDGPKFFNAQIETFCQINGGGNMEKCIAEYAMTDSPAITGNSVSGEKLFGIFANNVNVLILTLFLSLLFGAGAIFILAWNASVIAVAMGIFAKSDITQLPLALIRYMIHGIPEIAAYFIGALAGGILSIAVIRRDTYGESKWQIMSDSIILVVIALFILLLAAIIEVFITPKLF